MKRLAALATRQVFMHTSKRGIAKYNALLPEEMRVILLRGTEYPGTGALLDNKAAGTYICRQCNAPLYQSA